MSETIYLDTCALNRLNDTPSQPRIRNEAEAVVRILDLVSAGKVRWAASSVLHYEIARNSDAIRRLDALEVLSAATEIAQPTAETLSQAQILTHAGLSYLDALHLATARQVGADWLLTTDDRFLKAGNRLRQNRAPELINPVNWLQRRHLWLLQHP